MLILQLYKQMNVEKPGSSQNKTISISCNIIVSEGDILKELLASSNIAQICHVPQPTWITVNILCAWGK